MMQFIATDLRHNHPSKPLDTAEKLSRSMAEGFQYDASLSLEFADEGLTDASDKMQEAFDSAQDSVRVQAIFGLEENQDEHSS